MRFSAALFVGVFAAFATAQSSDTTAATTVSTANMATSSAQAAINKCLDACDAGDVNCRAKCIAVRLTLPRISHTSPMTTLAKHMKI